MTTDSLVGDRLAGLAGGLLEAAHLFAGSAADAYREDGFDGDADLLDDLADKLGRILGVF